MVFGEILLIILIVCGIFAVTAAVLNHFSGPNSGNRDLKRQLERSEARNALLETTMDDLLSYAYDNRTEAASFADLVIDEIKKTKRKELS